jgi:hypothetical protein
LRKLVRLDIIVFVAAVIANFMTLARSGGAMPPPWITYAPLPPLALLSFSGLYLFALPYLARTRNARVTPRDE